MVNKQETHLDSIFTGLGPKICFPHSSIFFFSHPSSVLTHSSPGERQSFEMKGIFVNFSVACRTMFGPFLLAEYPSLPLLSSCCRKTRDQCDFPLFRTFAFLGEQRERIRDRTLGARAQRMPTMPRDSCWVAASILFHRVAVR